MADYDSRHTKEVVYSSLNEELGRNISLDNKHKQLFRRFEAKYENMPKEK